MIDAAARETHFLDHIAPIWRTLSPAQRGTLYVDRRVSSHARRLGLHATIDPITQSDTPTLVASWGDLRRVRKHRPVIYMEHGAGQSYTGLTSGSYVGGDRDGVIVSLVPNDQAADRHTAAHPDVPVWIVGSPRLDELLDVPKPTNARPVVALSHHWDCQLVPETRSAWEHYRRTYKALAAAFPGAIGHAHPRAFRRLERGYRASGLEPVASFGEVVERADVYVCDNSSTLFEFAALDRPVVMLNAPWYRRDVNHGGRFWDWADIGVEVDEPGDLIDAVRLALADPPEIADRRRQLVTEIYANRGNGTGNAIHAIQSTLSSRVAA